MQQASLWPLHWSMSSLPPQPCPLKPQHHHFLVLSSPVLYPSLSHHQIRLQITPSHHSPLVQISLDSSGPFSNQHNHHHQRHGETYFHLSKLYVSLKRLQLQGWFFRIAIAATCVCSYIIKRSKGRSQSGKRPSKHLREGYSQAICSYRPVKG